MRRPNGPSGVDATAGRLRKIALAEENGALLGSEEALVARLGASRGTVRQVARLLEREGLLKVRRGINGGYFAARPDASTIETTVSAYLETLDMDAEDVTVVASVLWVEVLRKAAGVRTGEAVALAERFRQKTNALHPDASLDKVLEIEQESRTAIFDLVKSRYIELIFHINTAFAQRRFPVPADRDDTMARREFIRAWRQAKLMELAAIADGDQELAVMAARHMRTLWHRRVWGRDCP